MICPNCKTENNEFNKFCKKCGSKLIVSNEDSYSNELRKIILIFSTFLLVIVMYYILSDFFSEYEELVFKLIFYSVISFFVVKDYDEIKKLFELRQMNKKLVYILSIIALVYAFVVGKFVTFMKETFQYIYIKNYSETLIYSIFLSAVLPSLFEELAFRGVFFNALSKITSEKSVIIITTFLFAMFHFSVISILWIFPLGYFLGYLRAKYNTLIYSVYLHFLYNLNVCIFEYLGII